MFFWYRINGDGSATRFEDSPTICAQVDANVGRWYGSLEGAIASGEVNACAFTSKTEQTYDAAEWLRTGAMIPMGEITTLTITATPKESPR
jgi:hypothetical protein